MRIYVGNLSYNSAEEDVRQAFASHGEVTDVNVITDKFTGKSKGFAFVEMPNREQAEAAIDALNDSDFQGMTLRVSEARPRTERRDRRDGGGGGYRGGRRW